MSKAGVSVLFVTLYDNDQIFQYLNEFEEKDAARQLSLWDWGVS